MAEHKNEPVTGAGVIALPVAIPGGQSASQVTQDATQVGGILFPTLARTHTGGVASDGVYATDAINNPGARGVRIFSVVADGSGTVVIKIQVQDPGSDLWVDLAGAATAALDNQTTGIIITVYPGLTGIADSTGVTINQHLGPVWRLVATVATAAETFSVGAHYLL